MTKDTLYRALARCIIFAEQSEEWSHYAEEVKREALEAAKQNEDRMERARKEAENGKRTKKDSGRNGKTRHSDVSFSTEHQSKQTA